MMARLVPHAGFAPENAKRLKDRVEDMEELILITEDEGVIAILAGMIERKDRDEQLRKSAVKHQFIFGRHDYYIPNEVAEELERTHPEARTVWLDHSGHMGFIEEPEKCAEAIKTFILG
jgi:pimeloyl-ACP methyl ester carboxylesterase